VAAGFPKTLREETQLLPELPFLIIAQHLQSILEHALRMDQTIITVPESKKKGM
jgi:hypothetical protein